MNGARRIEPSNDLKQVENNWSEVILKFLGDNSTGLNKRNTR
jgi:hypothetical protein